MKLVSVIIPTWNREEFLVDAIESVLGQTYRCLELLIVDDGSTDGTRGLLEKYAGERADGVSIRPFFLSHEGISAARQFGLKMANGEYIQFLDSDDVLLPTKLERQVESLDQMQSVCCLSLAWNGHFDSLPDFSQVQFDVPSWKLVGREIRSGQQALAALSDGIPYVIHAMTPLWRRDFLMAQAPWPTEFCSGEDLVYFARVFRSCEGAAFAFVDEPLALLRDHSEHRATVSPRLSGWDTITDSERMVRRSALLSRAEMVRELQKCGGWCRQWASGCARQLQVGYWDALHVMDESELREYEDLILDLVSFCSRMRGIIQTRRRIGSKFIVGLLKNYLAFRLQKNKDN